MTDHPDAPDVPGVTGYHPKAVTVEAVRWFKNGDHPDDACGTYIDSCGKPFHGEGHVVRYYRAPGTMHVLCPKCNNTMHYHGWIDGTLWLGTGPQREQGQTVCPGNWISYVPNQGYTVHASENPPC